MPVTHLIHPVSKKPLLFHEAPAVLEAAGVMPAYAVEAIVREHAGQEPAWNVRPSDVVPAMVCRRQRVWETTNDYGVNPLEAEGMLEGSAFHSAMGSMEVDVPTPVKGEERRLEVCGVPMRGRIDWLHPDRIEDLKTSAPFMVPSFPTPAEKAQGARVGVRIWEPKDDEAKWRVQLSIYRVLLEKDGIAAPTKGVVWRRYAGVKPENGRWRRFEFNLLDEAGLEREVGPWIRSLAGGLTAARGDEYAWRSMPADGREMIGSRGNQWKCDRCPLRAACEDNDKGTGYVSF
jgi:hypothetical protein